jgi:hypothetical protein
MRLGTCLLFERRTLQGAHPKLADFCSAPVAGFYAAVDTGGGTGGDTGSGVPTGPQEERIFYFYHPDHLGSSSYVTD